MSEYADSHGATDLVESLHAQIEDLRREISQLRCTIRQQNVTIDLKNQRIEQLELEQTLRQETP